MGDGDQGRPKPTSARFALAANLRTLMSGYDSLGISSRQLAVQAGVSYKTIDRMLNPYTDTGPSLESIDSVAAFFRLETWQLLRPTPKVPLLAGQERPPQEGVLRVPSLSKVKKRHRA